MKRSKITALFLAIVLMFSFVTPMLSFAADDGDDTVAEEALYAVPYIFRTQLVDNQANKVKVWLELNTAIAEGVSAYEVAIQIKNGDGIAMPGRNAQIEFDSSIDAPIKEAIFDSDEQTMQIYVAGVSNLVKVGTDASGNIINTLPIGTVTVEKLADKTENSFKIMLKGDDGGLKTVGLDCVVNDASELYGDEDGFVIPVDGTVFAVPNYDVSVNISGKGSAVVYKINDNGTETDVTDGSVVRGDVIRVEATPESGYKLSGISVSAGSSEVALDGESRFTVLADCSVSVTFESETKPEEPTVPPTEPGDDDVDTHCSCICHKTGFLGFIYKIIRIFWKLFGTKPVCECGLPHN